MSEDGITYADVEEYQTLFTLTPSFLLERFAKKDTNLVLKFKSIIQSYMNDLTEDQKHKLDLILGSEIDELQSIMAEAFSKTGKKQYQILANPKYKPFIEDNLDEIRKMI